MGVLQVTNKLNNDGLSFSQDELSVLTLAAEQLSELLQGRSDVFVHAGDIASFKTGADSDHAVFNSSDI
eukprot:gene8431-10733_t